MELYRDQDLKKGVLIETDDGVYYVGVGTHVALIVDVDPHLEGHVELSEAIGPCGDLTHEMKGELNLPADAERTVEFTITVGDASSRP